MPNFDARRFADGDKFQVQTDLIVELREGGKPVGRVRLPASDVEGKSGDELADEVSRALRAFKVSTTWIQQQRLRKPRKGEIDPLEGLAQVISMLVVANVAGIYEEKLQGESAEPELAPNVRPESAHRFGKVEERVKKELLAQLEQDPGKAHDAATLARRHVMAWAISSAEAEIGIEAFWALPEEEKLAAVDKYQSAEDPTDEVLKILFVYAQDLARSYLEELDPEDMSLAELREFLDGALPPRLPAIPDAFPGGTGRFPNNPVIASGLEAIWKGGGKARDLVGGWKEAEAGQLIYQHAGNRGGRILVYPNLVRSATDPLPTTEALWRFVEGLSPFTSDVALAVLAQMMEPSQGDKPKHPLLQPVRITADAILRYKGIQRWGMERRLLRQKVFEEMERLRALHFDIEEFPVKDPKTKHWDPKGASYQGDRFFDIVKVEQYQEGLFGERETIETCWSVRAGQWAYWWLNPQSRVYVSHMAKALLELDHRENRPAAVMAKKIGQRVALLDYTNTNPKEMWIIRLLEGIGELPDSDARDKDWAGRTRDRFDAAMLALQEAGIFVGVDWPLGSGPDDGDRSRGWVKKWLQAKVVVTLPEEAPEVLAGEPGSLPAPRRRRKSGPHRRRQAAEPRVDGAALRQARVGRGLSQETLAKHLGISEAYLSLIENGKRLPSKSLSTKLAAWLGEAGLQN